MNSYTAIGRVGRDAEVRHTANSETVAGFSVAVDSGYGAKKQTLWFDCSVWGKRAESLAQYIKKGDRIAVQGELGTRQHDGKTYLTLRTSDVTLLGEKPAAEQKAS